MIRNIYDEYERLGIDDLEDIDTLKEMGLTSAAYPYYDEDVIEAVMNMLNVPLEKALKIWDNDNTRFDYYEDFSYDPMYAHIGLAEHRIEDLEEIQANNDMDDYAEEIANLKSRLNSPEEEANYLQSNGWMIYSCVAVGWDMEVLNKFMETM